MGRKKKLAPSQEQMMQLTFPLQGIDLAGSFSQQRPGTTPVGQNVRAFDPRTGRARGGSRPGLVKYINDQVSGTHTIQELNYVVGSGYSAPNASATGGSVTYSNWIVDGGYDSSHFGTLLNGHASQLATGFSSTSAVPVGFQSACCFDGDGNAYIAQATVVAPYAITVKCLSPTGATVWSSQTLGTVAPGATSTAPYINTPNSGVFGMVVANGILYVHYPSFGNTANNSSMAIATFAISDGSVINSAFLVGGPSGNNKIPNYNGGSDNHARRSLAVSGGWLGVVGQSYSTNGTSRAIAQFVKLGGGYGGSYTVGGGTNVISGFGVIVGDDQGNFYVSGTAYVSGTQYYVISKITYGGLEIWTQSWATSGLTAPSSLDIAYDKVGNRLVVVTPVGLIVAAKTVVSLSSNSGAVVTSTAPSISVIPYTINVWKSIAVDAAGVFRIAGDDSTPNVWASARLENDLSTIVYYAAGFCVASGSGTGGYFTTIAGTIGGTSTSGAAPTTPPSGRIVTVVAVSNGNVKITNGGAWATPTNGTGALSSSAQVVRSAANGGKLYMVDGSAYKVYDPATNAVSTWAATSGSLPVDGSGNKATLIANWRAGIMLAGVAGDPQNWFLSKRGDPNDWNYSPSSTSEIDAIAGNNAPAGLIGDKITALIPYTNDVMIFGGDHTINLMSGDPMAGGRVDVVTNAIGIAWGIAWCMNPFGQIYFFSNHCGVYEYTPGEQPQRISQPVEDLLAAVDTGLNLIRLAWDDRMQGVHIYVAPSAGAAASQHYFWEYRTRAWWTDVFTTVNQTPLCCVTYDGNTANDRVLLIGSYDGYVRGYQQTAINDDGTAISSEVLLGPVVTPEMDDILMMDLQAILGEDSNPVTFEVYTGATAEQALSASVGATGTWSAGRNLLSPVRLSGHAIFVKLTSTGAWSMEQIRARVKALGKVRRRGY